MKSRKSKNAEEFDFNDSFDTGSMPTNAHGAIQTTIEHNDGKGSIEDLQNQVQNITEILAALVHQLQIKGALSKYEITELTGGRFG